jgi:hypothetical protein
MQSVRAKIAALVTSDNRGKTEATEETESQRLFRFSEAMASADRSVNIITERSQSRERLMRKVNQAQ